MKNADKKDYYRYSHIRKFTIKFLHGEKGFICCVTNICFDFFNMTVNKGY